MSEETPTQRDGQPALDFKSATLYALRVVLHTARMPELEAALAQRMNDAGSFFENEPVVIDASALEEPLDWAAIAQALRSHHLHPIGVIAPEGQQAAASAQGLPGVELARPVPRPAATPAPEQDIPVVSPAAAKPAPAGSEGSDSARAAAPAKSKSSTSEAAKGKAAAGKPAAAGAAAQEAPAAAPAAMVINRPLRSGQRVYARDTDLIVIGVVSQGAEVIADGNIHVYGPLRGKAMAGARGDASARIFTTELDPELLAIAGVYRVIETRLDPSLHGRPSIVQLEGQTLRIVPVEA